MFYVGGFHLRCPSLRRRGSGTADRRISSEGRSFLGTVVFEQNVNFVQNRGDRIALKGPFPGKTPSEPPEPFLMPWPGSGM